MSAGSHLLGYLSIVDFTEGSGDGQTGGATAGCGGDEEGGTPFCWYELCSTCAQTLYKFSVNDCLDPV